MASYAPIGGGVGPHFDYYDVFLVQISGQREWRLGQQCDESSPLKADSEVKLLDTFDTQSTHIASHGDVFYIPAGRAHWGVAASNDCMTLSVGFRAPSQKELMEKVFEHLADGYAEHQRYRDPQLTSSQHEASQHESLSYHPAKITPSMQQSMYGLLGDLSAETIGAAVHQAFGELVTEPRYFQSPEEHLESTVLLLDKQLAAFDVIHVVPLVSTRIAFSSTHLFVNGNSYEVSEAFSQSLCDGMIPVSCIGEIEKAVLLNLLAQDEIQLTRSREEKL